MDGGEAFCSGLGFKLGIGAISAGLILLRGLAGAFCSADSVEDGLVRAGGGSDPPCQVHLYVDACVVAGEKRRLPCVSATRVPETEESDILSSLDALAGWSSDLGRVFLFLLVMVKQGERRNRSKKLSARGDDSGKRKRRDVES